MILDNFRAIEKILFFDDRQETFYFIQVLLRKKDLPEKVGSNSVVLKTMYVDSMDSWKKKEALIRDLCDKTGARAYIHPMPKSYKMMTKQMLKIISDKIYNGDFQSPQNVAEKAAGTIKGDFPRWVVDLDNITAEQTKEYIDIINNVCEPREMTSKDILTLPTKHGFHLIAKPFNVNTLKIECENRGMVFPDIHKNNPTLLYVNDALHTGVKQPI